MHGLVFINNFLFHFSLSFLGKNYDVGLKVAKMVLSIVSKFNMISAQYSPWRDFLINFIKSSVDIVNVLFYLSVVIC